MLAVLDLLGGAGVYIDARGSLCSFNLSRCGCSGDASLFGLLFTNIKGILFILPSNRSVLLSHRGLIFICVRLGRSAEERAKNASSPRCT